MNTDQPAHARIAALETTAARALEAGRVDEALRAWAAILDIDFRHTSTLMALGQHAFRQGDMAGARQAFSRAIESDGSDVRQWINLAIACRNLKDEEGEEAAIKGALGTDPMDFLALNMRGNLMERRGDKHEAARAYSAAATVAPDPGRLHPDLRPALAYAQRYRAQYDSEYGAFMDEYLAVKFGRHEAADLGRFRDSLDIMLGRKRRFDSQSAVYHYPRLTPLEFFPRASFPWLDAIEAATDQIREEFLQILAADQGFTPYIAYPDDVPHNQFEELNRSPRWSAFHLYQYGRRIEENAAKCPKTMALLDSVVPKPIMAARTPAAMFSLLKPKTRIPPHHGVTNARLVTHLPLIVPEGCGFRVGNETRQWVPGQAWVFDDTIEHEAWNDSEFLRVVLIFDIWHPQLSESERAMVSATMEGLCEFTGNQGGFEL